MLHALVVDDDMHSLSALAELVEAEGFDTATADNLAQAQAAGSSSGCRTWCSRT